MSWIILLTVMLAAWRIATLLADDTQVGPWEMLAKFRSYIGVTYDQYSQMNVKPGSLAQMATCVSCNSLWIGTVFTIFALLAPEAVFWVALPFAISAASILIDRR